MKATCVACGREVELAEEGPLEKCASCGGELKRVIAPPTADATKETPVSDGTIELVEDSLEKGITCPNCGKWIEPGAQICTACGYSRRLGRTLTTRVGMPEIPRHKKSGPEKAPEEPEIEAERAFRRAKERALGARADTLRLFVAVMWLVVLSAIVMGAPMHWFDQRVPLKFPPLFQPPKFDTLNASFLMLMFLAVATPITAIAVRIAAAMTGIEINKYFNWLRTAGALAAALVTLEILFTVDQLFLHLETRWSITAIAVAAALALLAFTWYLQDVNFSSALVLWLATLIGAAIGLLAAAAAFGWLGHLVGIDPVIKPLNTWKWPFVGG